jgi:cytochrome c oxidase cbb3-type subunit 4
MDAGTLRGLYTLLMLLIFAAICIWAFSSRRKSDFDDAANLPLEEDDAPDQNNNRS